MIETRSGNLIEPVYPQDQPNAAFPIGTHRARIDRHPVKGECEIEAEMIFVPRLRLRFRVDPGRDAMKILKWWTQDDSRTGDVELLDRGVTIPVIFGSASTLLPARSPVQGSPDIGSLQRAVMHVFNFPEFRNGTDYAIQRDKEITLCGRLVLEAEGWRTSVAALKDTSERHKALNASGGYMLTHMIEIRRCDGGAFSSDELTDYVWMLHEFLSFAIGRWAGMGFVCAYDAHGRRVWEQWDLARTDRDTWSPSLSWFNPHNGRMLHELFPGFVNLWNNPTWNGPLRHALSWHVEANAAHDGISLDSRLILAQAALETVAWTYCVRSRGMVSETAFGRGGLSAADKLRLLLSACGIPVQIPDDMHALNGRRGRKWDDGPEAVTTIRNQLVHPGKSHTLPSDSFYEVWQLAMWYLELALLHIAGYSGRYANRLKRQWIVQTEPVPWNSEGNTAE